MSATCVKAPSPANSPAEVPDESSNHDVAFCREFLASQNKGIITSFPGLQIFNESDHSAELRTLSRSMSITEICDFYGISFDSLPEVDQLFFCRMFLKGRALGTLNAAQALFKQMNEKDGARASLTYLKTFAPSWQAADSENLDVKQPRRIVLEVIGGD